MARSERLLSDRIRLLTGGLSSRSPIDHFSSSVGFQNFLPSGMDGTNVLETLLSQMPPFPVQCFPAHGGDEGGFEDGLLVVGRGQAGFIALDHLLQHPCGRDARQIGPAGGTRQGEGQPDQVVHGIADHGLVQIADLDIDLAFRVGEGPEVAGMAIAADPHGRPVGDVAVELAQPFVMLDRIAPNEGMRRFRHFQHAPGFEDLVSAR